MDTIKLSSVSSFTTEPGYAYRLLAGELGIVSVDSDVPVKLSGGWDFFYWHNQGMQPLSVSAVAENSEVGKIPLSVMLGSPLDFCQYLSVAYMHYLLLRLNLFSHERHAKQVLKFYLDKYNLLYTTVEETVLQQGQQMLQRSTSIKHTLVEEDEADSISSAGMNLGNTVIFSRSKKAEQGVYIVRDDNFSLLLDNVEVLGFSRDQIVYLPHEVVSLPGYMTRNDGTLARVSANISEFMGVIRNCPGVVSRFIELYSSLCGQLLLQCALVRRGCLKIRADIYSADSADSLYHWFNNINRYAFDEVSLKGYAVQASEMGNSCQQAVLKLAEEEKNIFAI